MPSALPADMAKQRQDLNERAFRLAERVFKLFPRLVEAGAAHAFVARHLLSAATSIGANLEEGQAASSRRDMAAKYAISLRESREAKFWSRLVATDPRWTAALHPIIEETGEFSAMLTVSVRKLRQPAPALGLRTHSLNRRSDRSSRPRRR